MDCILCTVSVKQNCKGHDVVTLTIHLKHSLVRKVTIFQLFIPHTKSISENSYMHQHLQLGSLPVYYNNVFTKPLSFSYYFICMIVTLFLTNKWQLTTHSYLFANCTNPHPFPAGIFTDTTSPNGIKESLSSSSVTSESRPPTNI